jgi:cytoskeletal protein RodZ
MFTMRRPATSRTMLLVVTGVLLLSGCGSNEGSQQVSNPPPQTTAQAQVEPQTTAEPTQTEPKPTATTENETPAAAGGYVPADLVGAWTGGPGSRSGFRYEFNADGTYQFTGILQQEGGPTYILQESGVVDVSGSRMRLDPQEAQFRREPPSSPGEPWRQVDQPPRTVRWTLMSAAGIEVLRLIDEASGGESSFVRDTP